MPHAGEYHRDAVLVRGGYYLVVLDTAARLDYLLLFTSDKLLCYHTEMKKKSLIETNPYLKDPKALEEAVAKHVQDSTAIEGGRWYPGPIEKPIKKSVSGRKS